MLTITFCLEDGPKRYSELIHIIVFGSGAKKLPGASGRCSEVFFSLVLPPELN